MGQAFPSVLIDSQTKLGFMYQTQVPVLPTRYTVLLISGVKISQDLIDQQVMFNFLYGHRGFLV